MSVGEVSGRRPKIPSREKSSQLVDAAISCLDPKALENGSQLYRVGYQKGNGEETTGTRLRMCSKRRKFQRGNSNCRGDQRPRTRMKVGNNVSSIFRCGEPTCNIHTNLDR